MGEIVDKNGDEKEVEVFSVSRVAGVPTEDHMVLCRMPRKIFQRIFEGTATEGSMHNRKRCVKDGLHNERILRKIKDFRRLMDELDET